MIDVQYVICEESFWQLLNSFSILYINNDNVYQSPRLLFCTVY